MVSSQKVVKNQTEIDNLKHALLTESCALISTYAQIKAKISEGTFYEHHAEAMLRQKRQRYGGDEYLLPSFPAIVGAGPNGAIVHYRPMEGTDRKVTRLDECVLIDTGAHYMQGTTDTTRTLVFSDTANHELKEMYTRVLMGNLDLESTCFPAGKTFGYQIEPFARRHLWKAGVDFGHSVGHGVSHCGPVHEYPHYAFARNP